MEKFICRPDESHWCADCCDSRNCGKYDELPDGTWGCLIHERKPKLCRQVNCLTEMGITYDQAMEKIRKLPPGEFFASQLVGTQNDCQLTEF